MCRRWRRRWTLAWIPVTYGIHAVLYPCSWWMQQLIVAFRMAAGESAGGEGGYCVILMWALGQENQVCIASWRNSSLLGLGISSSMSAQPSTTQSTKTLA
jgi:hypothetical protein